MDCADARGLDIFRYFLQTFDFNVFGLQDSQGYILHVVSL